MHNASPASTVIHLLGGLDGTGGLSITREAPTASPKSLPISGAENEPSGHGEVLLL